MRLIKQTTLHFQEGSSDKIYEVDLCEAGNGEFVVNFRYGRRGSRLREGTKTPFPESLAKAEAIFEKLVLSKRKKGYAEANPELDDSSEPETMDTSNEAPSESVLGGPEQRTAVRRRLEAARESRAWPLSRVVWRAGELGLAESALDIAKLSGKSHLHDYSIAWTLGKLGSSQSVETLRKLRQHQVVAVSRIAGEALLQCLPADAKAEFEDEILRQLPTGLQETIEDTQATLNWLRDHGKECQAPNDTLYLLYALAERYPSAREAVYDYIKPLPMARPWFRSIRHVFKAAEFRLDGEVYGMIVRKFEKQHGRGGAFSMATRKYLKRRVIRTLRRAGELADLQTYVTLATGVLMAYDDEEDLVPPRVEADYHYNSQSRRYESFNRHFGHYAPYLTFNYILYLGSVRFEYRANASAIGCYRGYEPQGLPGDAGHEGREEAFPELWNEAPEAIAHLLGHSRCGAVHEFAINVWRANPDFNKTVTTPLIIQFLQQAYPVTQTLGLDLARDAYDEKKPDGELLVALIGCDLQVARTLACHWLRSGRATFINDANVLAAIMLTSHEDAHLSLREIISLSQPRDASTFEVVLGKVVAHLLALDENGSTVAAHARESLLATKGDHFENVHHDVLSDLLAHPLAEVQLLGAQILLRQKTPAHDIPDNLWEGLLLSQHQAVRSLGLELFGKLTDDQLLERADILASFCLSERADIREGARSLVERLAKYHDTFAKDMVERFYPVVLRKETYEGVHADTYQLLEGPLRKHLHVIPSDSCLRMLDSKHSAGQQLGLLILQDHVGLKNLPMATVARLGSQDLVATREYIWDYYQKHTDRVLEEKDEALRLIDSPWQDTRDFAFRYFSENFEEKDWTPELLVSICDSVRGDVADFGRRQITRFFQEKDGPEYLLKLSQHPTAEMQTFASAYLERFASDDLDRFASDDLDRLQVLEDYLVTVLSQVNRGRVAKARTLKFLAAEATRSEEAAKLVARVLTRQSVTIAIHDKAACIQTLHAIREQWPSIETPLQVRSLPVYQPH